jgi:hypothetical protein
VVLATFAYHLPPNYSLEAFKAHQLDYAKHACPAETWGKPEYLKRTLDAHNAAVCQVANRTMTRLVDVAGEMPRGKAWFDDPCHLTPEGCWQYVEIVVRSLP